MPFLNEVEEPDNPEFKVTRLDNNIVIEFSASVKRTADDGDGPKKVKLELVVPENLNLTFDIFVNKDPIAVNIKGNKKTATGSKDNCLSGVNDHVSGDLHHKEESTKDLITPPSCIQQNFDFLGDFLPFGTKINQWSMLRHVNPFLPLAEEERINGVAKSLSTIGVQTDVLLGAKNISDTGLEVNQNLGDHLQEKLNASDKLSEKLSAKKEKCPVNLIDLKDFSKMNTEGYKEKFSDFFSQLKKESPCEFVDFLYKIYMIPVKYLLSMYSDIEESFPVTSGEKNYLDEEESTKEVEPLLSKLIYLENKFEVLKMKMPNLEEGVRDRPSTPYQDALSDWEQSEFYECSDQIGYFSDPAGIYQKKELKTDCGFLNSATRQVHERIGDFGSLSFSLKSQNSADARILWNANSSLQNLKWPKQNLPPMFSDPSDVIM